MDVVGEVWLEIPLGLLASLFRHRLAGLRKRRRARQKREGGTEQRHSQEREEKSDVDSCDRLSD
jgi:hypothetical protein